MVDAFINYPPGKPTLHDVFLFSGQSEKATSCARAESCVA